MIQKIIDRRVRNTAWITSPSSLSINILSYHPSLFSKSIALDLAWGIDLAEMESKVSQKSFESLDPAVIDNPDEQVISNELEGRTCRCIDTVCKKFELFHENCSKTCNKYKPPKGEQILGKVAYQRPSLTEARTLRLSWVKYPIPVLREIDRPLVDWPGYMEVNELPFINIYLTVWYFESNQLATPPGINAI